MAQAQPTPQTQAPTPPPPAEDLDALWQQARPVSGSATPSVAPGQPVQTVAQPQSPPSIDDLLRTPVPGTSQGGAVQGNTGLAETRRPGFLSAALDIGGKVLPPALEIGGSLIGQKLMAPAKGAAAAGGFIRRAVPEMLGAGAGEAAGTSVGHLIDPPPTVAGRLDDISGGFAAGAAGVPLAGGLSKGWQVTKGILGKTRIGAPMASRVTPEAKEAFERGIEVTPAMATGSRGVRVIENIVGGSLGGSQYETALKEMGEQFSRATQEELAQFGKLRTPEALGRRVQAAIQHAERAERKVANEAYEAGVWPLADELGVAVPLAPLKAYSEEELAKRGLSADVAGGKGIRFLRKLATGDKATEGAQAELTSAAQYIGKSSEELLTDPRYNAVVDSIASRAGIPREALQNETGVPFRAAHYLRSAANAMADEAGRAGDYETAYLARQVYARLDDSMEAAAKQAGGGLDQAYRRATKLWRDLRTRYQDSLAEQVIKAEPRTIVQQVIKPHRVRDIQQFREIVGDRTWADVQRSFAEELVGDASDITKNLHKYGRETLEAVFPRGTADGLYQLGRIADTIGAKGPGTGKVWVELTQAGAATGLLMGRQPGKATALLLGPWALGRIVLSPTGRQFLTTGLRATHGKDPAKATKAASQLVTWLVKEGLIDRQRPTPQGGPPQPIDAPSPPTGRGGGPGPLGGPPAVR